MHGVEIEGASPTIIGNTFDANGTSNSYYDILCDETALPSITQNLFRPGNLYAVKLGVAAVDRMRDNSVSNRAVHVMGGALTQNSRWRQQGISFYYVDRSVTVAGPSAPDPDPRPGQHSQVRP